MDFCPVFYAAIISKIQTIPIKHIVTSHVS
jgi:hypothetical protein